MGGTDVINIILLLCVFRQRVSQGAVQNYIRIKPAVMSISEDKAVQAVRVICTQIPPASAQGVSSLAILRRPLYVSKGTATDVRLVEKWKEGLTDVTPDRSKYTTSGDSAKLILTIPRATCEDARYTYICRMTPKRGPKNSLTATIKTDLVAPSVVLRASLFKAQYTKSDRLTLTCSTKAAVGLTIDASTKGVWVWEYNDGGRWVAANARDITHARSRDQRCFQKIASTALRVKVSDFKECARRFRCYTHIASSSASDNAQEFDVNTGYDCKATGTLGTDPVVAIVGVLAVLVVFFAIAVGVFQASSRARAKKKLERKKQFDQKILSPMSPAQRDKLLRDKLEKMEKEPRQKKKSLVPAPLITLEEDFALDVTPESQKSPVAESVMEDASSVVESDMSSIDASSVVDEDPSAIGDPVSTTVDQSEISVAASEAESEVN